MTNSPLLKIPGIFFLLAGLLMPEILKAQEVFEFNRYGNECYLKYIIYSPVKNVDRNRPLIVVMGSPGQDAATAFKEDTLKILPSFANYLFVYVPNRGKTAEEKLGCIAALGHLLSFDYNITSINTFLQIKDTSLNQKDVKDNLLDMVFKVVRYAEKKTEKTRVDSTAKDVALVFKENFIVEKDDGGAYFYDAENPEQAGDKEFPQEKVYTGPPSAFNFTISGVIRDKKTGEALPFSTIQVEGSSNGVAANMDGYFTLLKVPTDTSTLVVQYMGYTKRRLFLDPSTPRKDLVIEMMPEIQTLKTFTVTAHREDVVLTNRNSTNLVKMTPKKLEQLPSMGEKDVMRSFQLMPGISSSMESSSGLYVRGGTPDQNLILYDGFTVYHVDHLYGFFSAFNSNALKDVQLYKGGFESKFGGRLSSVMEITGKDGNQNNFNMGCDLSLLSVNLFAEIPIGKKISTVMAFRRSYKGALYEKIFDKFNKSQTTTTTSAQPSGGPRGKFSQNTEVTSYFYDVNGKFTYRPNQKDIFSLSIFNGTDKLDNGFSSGASSFGPGNMDFSMNATDLTKYGNLGSSLKWARKWSPKLYGNTILSYSNYYSYRDKSQERTTIDSTGTSVTTKMGVFEDNNLRDYSLKSDYQYDILHSIQLQFGGFSTYYDIRYSYAQSDTSHILDRKNRSTLSGAYLQGKIKLFHDKLELIPGIRSSYFEPTSNTYFEPRAAITLNLAENLSLKASTGKFYQFANRVTREDILSGSRDFWILSDGNKVPVSSAIHYTGGIAYETEDYILSTELYYKKITGLSEYSLRFNPSPVGTSYDENFYSGYGYSKGIEFLVQKKTGKFNGWVSYTLGEAKNHFDVYSDSYYPANQDVKHEFKLVGLYKFKRWDFSATWVFATGRHYTAPSGAYSITLLDGTTKEFFTVTDKNGMQLPDYHRLDISANFKILGGEKGDKKRREYGYIGLSIFNVYNRENVWYKQYSIEDGAIIETNVKYLGFTPNITLSLKLR